MNTQLRFHPMSIQILTLLFFGRVPCS